MKLTKIALFLMSFSILPTTANAYYYCYNANGGCHCMTGDHGIITMTSNILCASEAKIASSLVGVEPSGPSVPATNLSPTIVSKLTAGFQALKIKKVTQEKSKNQN